MKGDFTRDTFDPANHFSHVLMQQGRVTLDADHNEQTAILLHYVRTLARDLIGPYAAPIEHGGFMISPANTGAGFTISPGRYYVHGMLIENDTECTYLTQPDYPVPDDDPLLHEINNSAGQAFWVYLDVWERHITFIEDDSIREAALNGPDTCTRAQVVWQIKALAVDIPAAAPVDPKAQEIFAERDKLQSALNATTDLAQKNAIQNQVNALNAELERIAPGGVAPPLPAPSCAAPLAQLKVCASSLTARLDPGKRQEDPCVTPPSSKYRGPENQLYRVEMHIGGGVGTATFKWSRENGSVTAAWVNTNGNDLVVSATRGFDAGDWVELTDDVLDLRGQPGILVRLANVDSGVLSVDPDSVPAGGNIAWSDQLVNPKVRCWNGTGPVKEMSASNPAWIDLEDGVQVQFTADGAYRSGDYWLMPARVATGDLEWPAEAALPPDGVEHHYAPLGFVMWQDKAFKYKPCRCEFEPLSSCSKLGSAAVGAALPKPGAAVLRRSTSNIAVKAKATKKS
jgi:hypothetical protein